MLQTTFSVHQNATTSKLYNLTHLTIGDLKVNNSCTLTKFVATRESGYRGYFIDFFGFTLKSAIWNLTWKLQKSAIILAECFQVKWISKMYIWESKVYSVEIFKIHTHVRGCKFWTAGCVNIFSAPSFYQYLGPVKISARLKLSFVSERGTHFANFSASKRRLLALL